MQSRSQSATEVCINTSVGMIGSWLITFIAISLIDDRVLAAFVTVLLCTIWSLVRGYYIRRHFAESETP